MFQGFHKFQISIRNKLRLDQGCHFIHVLPVQITQVFTRAQVSLLPEDF